jgi:hypothetical protein
VHAPVVTVGRLTIERIEPHGSLRPGVGDGDGWTAADGGVWAAAIAPQNVKPAIKTASPKRRAAVIP